jgi:peptide/nickel transport system ATP-binding protein
MGKLGIPHPEGVVEQYPHNLSGGMKQRIVIAIALACSPMLLIADEATSNLDVTIQAQILELLRELKQKEISSVLFITHDLGVVAETCDRVGVMYAGNLCEVADVRELFRRPLHPYTRALLDSVPKFSMEGRLKSIEGNVPNLVAPPTGCRFHPRCPHAMEVCRNDSPELTGFGDNHLVACHYVLELNLHKAHVRKSPSKARQLD